MSLVNIRYSIGSKDTFPPGNNVQIAKGISAEPTEGVWLDAQIVAEFWRRVESRGPDECWPWRGHCDVRGRGKLALGRCRVTAPRIAYAVYHGIPFPSRSQVVRHSCDNPNCVNPAHLFIGSQAVNMHDSVQKGRKNCWGHQKLTAVEVRAIRAAYAEGGVTQRDLGRRFGVARNTISQIVRGLCWKHVTDHARSLPPVESAQQINSLAVVQE